MLKLIVCVPTLHNLVAVHRKYPSIFETRISSRGLQEGCSLSQQELGIRVCVHGGEAL